MPVGVIADTREEFVKGRWVQLPPPSPAHFRLIQRLNNLLRDQLNWREFSVSTTAYGLGIERGLQACRNPDLALFRVEDLQHAYVQDNNIYAIPLLIAECLSPRDRKGGVLDLLDDYHRMHAPEVWIIDPQSRKVSRHLGSDERSDTMTELQSPLRPLALPEISIDVDELWRAFDGEW